METSIQDNLREVAAILTLDLSSVSRHVLETTCRNIAGILRDLADEIDEAAS
jgi:hypothetical protein